MALNNVLTIQVGVGGSAYQCLSAVRWTIAGGVFRPLDKACRPVTTAGFQSWRKVRVHVHDRYPKLG
jgi:hypothetical protein